MTYKGFFVCLLMVGYGRALLHAASLEAATQAETARIESAATAAAPAGSRDNDGVDFDVEAKGAEAKIESSCFVIGSDTPPGEDQKLVIPRQKICPFARIPAAPRSGSK